MRSQGLVVAVVAVAVLGWMGLANGGSPHPLDRSPGPDVPMSAGPTAVAPAAPAASDWPSALGRGVPTTSPTALLSPLPSRLDGVPWLRSLTHTGPTLAPLTSLPNLNLLEHPLTSVSNVVYPGYVAQPAPIGVSDLGLGASPYAYNTSHFLGQVTFAAPPNVTDPDSTGEVEPGGAALGAVGSLNEFGVQLNTVATNISYPGSSAGFFWTQNVVDWNDTGIHFVDDTFNFSSYFPLIEPGTIYSGCNNNTSGVDEILEVYGGVFQCVGGTIPVSPAAYPVTLQLYNNASVNAENRDQVAYGYRLVEAGTGEVYTGESDVIVFNSPSAPGSPPTTVPGFSVSGFEPTPLGLLRDAELDLVGDIGGDNSVFRSANGSLALEYSNLTSGGWQVVPSAYDFGGDTGETSTGLAETWEPNGTVVVHQGPTMLYGLWNAEPSVSVASGAVHLAGTITPSYGFVFVSNTPPPLDPFSFGNATTFDNLSWLPTDASGGFDTYLPPLGAPWTTEYYVQAFAAGSAEVNGSAVTGNNTSYTLSLPLAPGSVGAPLYAISAGQAAALAQNVSGSSSVPYTFANLTVNPNASFNHLNDYDFPSFELLMFQGLAQPVTVRNLTEGPGGDFYFGDGPAFGLLTSPPEILYGPDYTSQINLYDGAGDRVVDQREAFGGQVVLWHETNATVSNLTVLDFATGVFVGDSSLTVVRNVTDFGEVGVEDIGSVGTTVTSLTVGPFATGIETFSSSNGTYSDLHVGTDSFGIEGGEDYGAVDYLRTAYYNLPGATDLNVSGITGAGALAAVYLMLSSGLRVTDVTTNGSDLGVALIGDDGATVRDVTSAGDFLDLGLAFGTGGSLTGLGASNGEIGAILGPEENATVLTRSVFYDNTGDGVVIENNSSGNLVYDNSFFLNNGSGYTYSPAHIQAYSSAGNAFNLGGVGNFWADWHSFTDGVLNPYNISNGVADEHPLTVGPDTYFVTVSESGLPSEGKRWVVAMGDILDRTAGTARTPTETSLQLSLPNGTYGFLISGPAGYRASVPVGTVTISGSNVTQPVVFTPGPTYKLSFAEVGLGFGTDWCVTLGAAWQSCSARGTVAFTNLTPAAYPFLLENFSGTTPLYKIGKTVREGTSGVAPLASSEKVVVRYAYPVYFFAEFYLPGAMFKVSVGGTTESTYEDFFAELEFNLTNGTYTFHVHPVRGFAASTLVGQIVVDGPYTDVVEVTFTPDN